MNWRPRSEPRRAGWCSFEHDNPDPKPEPCPHCGNLSEDEQEELNRWAPTIHCYVYARYVVYLEDGTVVRACSPDAHGHSVVWSGELYLYPRKETISLCRFNQMLKDLYPVDSIEARMKTYGALMLCRYPVVITDV